MEAAYSEILDFDIMAASPININTPKKVKSPVAMKIQKLRKKGSLDTEIIEHLLETDGLTKLATPKNRNQETSTKLKRQEIILFTGTPPPIKRVLQPDVSDRNSHQRCSVRKGVLRIFTKFRGKHLCQSLFFNKVGGLSPATLLKKRPWHRCFAVNFAKFLRAPFLQNTPRRCFCIEMAKPQKQLRRSIGEEKDSD